METIKIPFQLALMETRCDATLFAVSQVEEMWSEVIVPMLEDKATPEEITLAFYIMLDSMKETVVKVKPVTLPQMQIDGIYIEIPGDRIKNYPDLKKLQNKINIAEEAEKKWASQQDFIAKSKKGE